MRLQKIQIKGFKSFADSVTLRFDKGLTCIVGPNGCGKSNIVDAIRWVLGEQSAKAMRGNKMSDVLFAGAEGRVSRESAEVTLTFVDVGSALPLQFDEFAIGRRLTSSGESTYSLNGNPARLKEIQSLFWDSGIGKDSFALFEQGKVDQIIQMGPQERRAIFEEVAGISRFRERKKEVLRKLEQTEASTTRLADLLEERQKQMDQLQRQAERATQYRFLSGQLDILEKAQLAHRFLQADGKCKQAAEELTHMRDRQLKAQAAHELSSQSWNAAKLALQEAQKRLSAQAHILYEVRKACELLAVQRAVDERRSEELQQRVDRLQRDLQQMEAQMTRHLEEERAAQDELCQIEEKIDESASAWHAAEKLLEEAAKQSEALQKNFRAAQSKKVELVQAQAEISGKLRLAVLRLETHVQRKSSLQTQMEASCESQEAASKLLLSLEGQMSKLRQSTESKIQAVHDLDAQITTLNGEMESSDECLSTLSRSLAEGRARFNALKRLKEEMADCSFATQTLLKLARRKGSPLYGLLKPLYEEIAIDPQKSRICASAMRSYSQTLFASSDEALETVWSYAEREGLTDFSITSPKLLERADMSFDCLLEAIEHRSTLKLDALPNQPETVFPDGVYLDRRGVLFRPSEGEGHAFLREAELKQLHRQIAKEEQESEQLKKVLAQRGKDHTALRERRADEDRQMRQAEIRLVEANFSLQQTRAQVEAECLQRENIARESDGLTVEIEELEAAKDALIKVLSEVDLGIEAHGKLDAELDRKSVAQRAVLKELAEWDRHSEGIYRQRVAEKRRVQDAVQVALQRQAELSKRRQQLELEAEQLAAQREQVEKQLLLLKEKGEQSKVAAEEAERFLADLESLLSAARETEHREGEEQSRLAARSLRLQQEAQSRELIATESGAIAQTVRAEALERFGLELDALLEAQRSIPQDAVEAEIKRLRKALEDLGNVNMASLDEYDARKEAHQDLEVQLEDLQQSKQELSKLISRLERSSRRMFKETFERIRQYFSQQFQLLFEGGEADLQLTEAKDVLEAGIEIFARPAGKQMRAISLLSGGERCLAAMALLFAIFQERPSPFALLDEMDAPLDDANVKRFLRVIESFKEQTQFLIVTHNKLTMAAANQLLGVTMEKKGISKLVYLSFESENPTCELADSSEQSGEPSNLALCP